MIYYSFQNSITAFLVYIHSLYQIQTSPQLLIKTYLEIEKYFWAVETAKSNLFYHSRAYKFHDSQSALIKTIKPLNFF